MAGRVYAYRPILDPGALLSLSLSLCTVGGYQAAMKIAEM